MTMKVDMNITCGRFSWTESHYDLNASNFLAAVPDATTLAGLRGQLCGTGAAVVGVRISEVPGNRNVDDLNIGKQIGTWPTDPSGLHYAAAFPNQAALIKLQTATINKNLYLAGLPAGIFNQPGGSVPGITLDGVVNSPLFAYLNALAPIGQSGGIWGCRVRDTSQEQNSSGLVTSATYPGSVGVVTQAAPTWAAGDEVFLTGWRRLNTGLPGLSGEWVVQAVVAPVAPATGPWTTFLLNSQAVSPTNFNSPGTIDLLSYVYHPYETWSIVKAVTRKRGGSYGAPRGRSRVRK